MRTRRWSSRITDGIDPKIGKGAPESSRLDQFQGLMLPPFYLQSCAPHRALVFPSPYADRSRPCTITASNRPPSYLMNMTTLLVYLDAALLAFVLAGLAWALR